jgi:hypothetical protein
MEYIERMQWIEACQMFFDAYVKYQMDCTEAHWYESNDRSIEISFFDNGGDLMVKLFCPEVMRTLTGYLDGSADKTEKIITMLRWLVWEAAFPDVYDITTADSEKEYKQIRTILTARYSRCYYTYCAEDYWKGEGEERFIIALHGKQIRVCFYPSDMWDVNGYIDVKQVCLETGERFGTVISQEEEDPEEIIREIQRMAWETA